MANLCAETNAILKLDLGDEGGIRRISLAKLWDPVTSHVSYQRLSEMALQYSNLSDSKLHCVTVTYTDEDGDIITISTDDELTDAFEQFSTRIPPIVRAKASFKVKKDGKNIMNGLKQAVSEISETVKNADGDDKKSKVNQAQDILDSFMTVLTQAIDTLSKNMEGVKQNNKKKGFCNIPKEVRARNKCNRTRGSAISELSKPDGTHKVSNNVQKKQETGEKEKAKDVNLSPELEEKQEDYSNVLPVKTNLDKGFIHNRHTCDRCLATPIIGIRYHALNLPDHDLCEKCVHKHSRKDIIFEPTELERDRYLQEKWKRGLQWRASREARGRCGQHTFPEKSTVCSVDSALKEAIRRSLQDVKPETEAKEDVKNENPPLAHDENTTESPKQAEKDEEKEGVEILIDEAHDEDLMDEEGEDALEKTLVDEEAEVVETLADEGTVKPANNDSNKHSEEMSDTSKAKIIERVDEQESPLLLKLKEEFTVDVTPIAPTTAKANDSSFTEDAEGQGDVAVAIGMALDFAADAIDAVVSEVDKSIDGTTKGCTILGSLNTANSNAKSEESSQSQSSVNSNDEWQVLDEDVDEDENGQVTSDEMISQAAQLLGSALFQSDIISDVTGIKDERTYTNSVTSGASLVDSVPTEVPTIASRSISSVVLCRWDTELKQLHELGFLDDEQNVNALAHLEAANMGVDSDDPVTVNAAVDHLLSKYNEQL